MTETKTFDPLIIGTMTTGIVLMELISLREVHRAATWILGREIWTHEMREPVMKEVSAIVLAKYPDFPVDRPADYKSLADDLKRRYPNGMEFERGTTERTQSPLETLQEIVGDKPIIVVKV